MISDLQQLVDAFGSRFERSVAIDDAHLRLLAYNGHTGEVDDMRVHSIMHREVPPALAHYLATRETARATGLFTVTPNPGIGLTVERIGMPIRYNGALLGYVWLVASDGPVPARTAEALGETAQQAALILHRDSLAAEVSMSHARELIRDLMSDGERLRTQAIDALIEEGHAVAGPVVALVAVVGDAHPEPLSERYRLAMDLAVDHTRRRLPPSRALTLTRPDHALLLTSWPRTRAESIAAHVAELADVLRTKLAAELGPDQEAQTWVGVGGSRPRLSEARDSYREAMSAADVARVTGALGQVAAYPQLGVYALLAQMTPEELAAGIHPGLRRLLISCPGNEVLVQTLRVYLDHAGDAQRAAAALHIHRSTLYQRLRRVEELTGLDLTSGDDRLAAHLGLKMTQLASPLPAEGGALGEVE
ncbi:PucR family transcriptional regulator [Streptomyces flavofungini]|uniref:PucR family transcriptional regulator n=1 Tax=Streptomyces flavofungini TaxID=68200 RepID=UPI0034DEDAF5